MIYTDDDFNPYPADVLAELKEQMESRGGWFAFVEAGNFFSLYTINAVEQELESEEEDMDDDYHTR